MKAFSKEDFRLFSCHFLISKNRQLVSNKSPMTTKKFAVSLAVFLVSFFAYPSGADAQNPGTLQGVCKGWPSPRIELTWSSQPPSGTVRDSNSMLKTINGVNTAWFFGGNLNDPLGGVGGVTIVGQSVCGSSPCSTANPNFSVHDLRDDSVSSGSTYTYIVKYSPAVSSNNLTVMVNSENCGGSPPPPPPPSFNGEGCGNRGLIGRSDVFWGDPPPVNIYQVSPRDYNNISAQWGDTIRLSLEGEFPGNPPRPPDCTGMPVVFDVYTDGQGSVLKTIGGQLIAGSRDIPGNLGSWQWYINWVNDLLDGRYRFKLVSLGGSSFSSSISSNILTILGASSLSSPPPPPPPPPPPATYTISGIVFNDKNGDGVFNGGDKRMAGESVYQFIYWDGAGGYSTNITDSQGHYSFTGSNIIPYRILHTVPTGFTATTPDSKSYPPLTKNEVYDFGVAEPPSPPPTPASLISTYRLTSIVNGNGTVLVNGTSDSCGPNATCSKDYPAGISASLTATPSSGPSFTGWSGCDSASGNICSLTLNSDRTVTANFSSAPPPPPGLLQGVCKGWPSQRIELNWSSQPLSGTVRDSNSMLKIVNGVNTAWFFGGNLNDPLGGIGGVTIAGQSVCGSSPCSTANPNFSVHDLRDDSVSSGSTYTYIVKYSPAVSSNNLTITVNSENCGGSPPPPPPPPPPPQPQAITDSLLRIKNPLSGRIDTIEDLFDALITFLYYLVAPIIVILIILAGLMFLFAKGEPGKVETAKRLLFWALVGFSIVLIGRGFIVLIESIIALGG